MKQSGKSTQQKDVVRLPVCIIGAGSSGVAAAKALKEKGVEFDCFEIGSDIGGMWRYENDNGLSSAYRSLHIDTSRVNLGYSDFPIPDHYPDFLSHFEVIDYLEAYAERFGVRPHITFGTKVEDVTPDHDTNWTVRLSTGETRRYRAVIVANGHLWDPRTAEFPGSFDGDSIHSHHYRTAERFKGKNVLIVGIGNSAVDIAVDVCKGANKTFLSTRRSAWVMPKYIMGLPIDRWLAFFSRRLKLPTTWSRSIVKHIAYMVTGDQQRFGIPRPRHAIWREHTTLSQELISYCGHGWIGIKPNVKQLDGGYVSFDDGSREAIDAIIYATGYKTTFPFLDPEVFSVRDGEASLYRRMLSPQRPGLYMLGLIQPVGPTIPLVEVQAKWLASVLADDTALPGRERMEAEVRAHREELARRYVGSARYTLEVDGRSYRKQLFGDISRGVAGI
ncbi:flavin-containing monooxygenase [Paraburkholderia unamae]|uniref:Flavin-containing monooxygenase 5 n=1 Tax=Paraburkholderia unamae TaxID=219649 RepID=A0ABX5KJQ0_9BURK|nr:NAD(P)-binding domain-containing protein [Paraburkholderia unamae]PVX81856.1 cation diffusion facilitator CzcD-associated flavoprotein CzcO [Paraburkholderia unamae]